MTDSEYCVAGRMTFTIPAAGWYTPLEAWRIGKNVAGRGSDLFDLYVTPLFVGQHLHRWLPLAWDRARSARRTDGR